MEQAVAALWKQSQEEPFRRLLGIEVEEIEPGRALVSADFKPELKNLFGMMHGGAVFSLLDEAFQLACNAHGSVAVALQVNIVYAAPPREGARIMAEVRESHASRRTATYQARVWQADDDKTLASGQCVAFRKGVPLPFLEPEKD